MENKVFGRAEDSTDFLWKTRGESNLRVTFCSTSFSISFTGIVRTSQFFAWWPSLLASRRTLLVKMISAVQACAALQVLYELYDPQTLDSQINSEAPFSRICGAALSSSWPLVWRLQLRRHNRPLRRGQRLPWSLGLLQVGRPHRDSFP